MKLDLLHIEVASLMESSSMVLGHFAQKGSPLSFLNLNIDYIDLLKRVTGLDSILNPKYCDIDP